MKTNDSMRSAGLYFVAIVATFFIMAWLVSFVRKYTEPPPLNQVRIEERRKALAELEAANADVLNHYGWVDQGKGLVRLPLDRAMQLTLEEWRKPWLARSNMLLLATLAASNPPPPAPMPKQPNIFE